MNFVVISALLVSVCWAQFFSQPPPSPTPSTVTALREAGTLSPLLDRIFPPHPPPSSPPSGPRRAPGVHPDVRALRCQKENETVPNWLDPTCQSYLVCTDSRLTVDLCEPESAYSYASRSCLSVDQPNCTAQRERFSARVRQFLGPFVRQRPHPTDFFTASFPNGTVPEDQDSVNVTTITDSPPDFRAAIDDNVDDFYNSGTQNGQGLGEEDWGTIDLNTLPSIVVDPSNCLNITLDSVTCQRLNDRLPELETSVNMALLMLTGCPDQACDVTLFRLFC